MNALTLSNSQLSTINSQPVPDVPSYLSIRRPVADFAQEDHLFITLPSGIRSDLRTLLAACRSIQSLVKGGLSVSKAVERAYAIYRSQLSISAKSLREKFDVWSRTGDWVSLVNRTRAGAAWQDREDGLPLEFLQFCAKRFGAYKRADGKRQALLAIKRQWLTGRNSDGVEEPIPGYSRSSRREEAPSSFPTGWSYSNILRQIKARNLLPDSVRLMLHQSTAAARSVLPAVRADRSALRFLEVVEFDDVKCDFLVVDPVSGQVCDLWLLVARDRATAILLGFGMRPARTREDGTQEHLRLRDMKQLCGWLLERYGLPPYTMTWKIEHGTATLSEGTRAALRELVGTLSSEDAPRINISYSSMIGGLSPAGYVQRAIGNSKGKASLESHNRLMHTMLADRPGQTGPLYTVRPSDLAARAKESAAIFEAARHLPEHLRNQVGYSLLTINQAREHLHRIFKLQNERTEHDLQGFEDVIEVWDASRSLWVPQSQLSAFSSQLSDLQSRVRRESPLERCSRLIAPYRDAWTHVSPEVITAFYSHTVREVVVKPNGLIEFRTDDRLIEFAPPSVPSDFQLSTQPALGGQQNFQFHLNSQLPAGTRLLAYFHPDDPAYLHLTDGKGRIIGTWLRRGRASDEDSIRAAIRYSQTALSAAKAQAASYEAAERERLEAIRARNAELLASATFDAVAPAISHQPSAISSPVSSALEAVAADRAAARAARESDARAAADEILRSSPAAAEADTDTDDFLSIISKSTHTENL